MSITILALTPRANRPSSSGFVLNDAASREDHLAQVTDRIAMILFDGVRPHENWGLLPYFSFRSKSEQDERNDPEWA